MDLFKKLLALVKELLPLPTFTDVKMVKIWLDGLSGPEAALIVWIAKRLQEDGRVGIALPGGGTVTLVMQGDQAVFLHGEEDVLAEALVGALPPEGRFGDGRILELLKKLLPLILKIIPIFLVFKDEQDEDNGSVEPPVV